MIDDLQLLHGALQFPVEVCCAGCNKPTTWAVSVSRLITYKLVHFTKGVMRRLSSVKERVFSDLRNTFSSLTSAVDVHWARYAAYGGGGRGLERRPERSFASLEVL